MKKYPVFMLVFIIATYHILGQTTTADFTKWHLPEGASARIGKGIVKDIAYSPDGKHLAVASYIGVWIYDTHTGTEKALLTANTGDPRNRAWKVVYSPDGQTLAVIQREVLLWDTRTYTLKGTLKGHGQSATDAVFSPDGQTLAIVDMNQTTQLWDIKTMTLKCTLEGSTCDYDHEGTVMFRVAYSPMGDTVAIGSEDGTIRLWDTTGKLKHTLIGNVGWGDGFSFRPDGKTIATQSFSNALWLWDTTTGRHKSTIRTFSKGAVAYSPDGNKVAASTGFYIILWDATTGKMQGILELETGAVKSFLFRPDGNKIAIMTETSTNVLTISLWDTATGKPYEFTPSEECGNSLYSDVPVPAGKYKYTFGDANWGVEGITFSPNGDTFAMVNTDGVVQLWNTETGELRYALEHASPVIDVAFSKFSNFNDSPNRENHLITVYSNNTVRMWNTNTQLCKHTFKLTKHTADVKSVAYSPDGNTVATASLDGTLHFWEIPSGMFKKTLTIGKYKEWLLGPFSPDGKTLAIGEENALKIVEIAPPNLKTAFNIKGYMRSIAYSPDGKTIAIAMESVVLWKTTTGALIDRIKCDYQPRNVTFSPDGKTLAIGTSYHTLLYDAKTRTRKHTLDADGTILKFSPDSKTLAHGGSYGKVLLSDTETGTQKSKLTGHLGTVNGIAFTADGNTIATAGEDGTVLLWNLTSNPLNTK